MKLQHSVALPDGVDILELDVAMSNALSLSSQGLSLFEKRLISAALAKMGQSELPTKFKDATWTEHEENWESWVSHEGTPMSVRISAADYAKAGDIDLSTAYTQLQDAVKGLWEAEITMKVKTPTGIKHIAYRWLYKKIYHEGEGYAELWWTPFVARNIFDLRKKFTVYKLKQIASLESVYAIRLFEQFVTYAPGKHLEKPGIYHPTIEEFIFSIGVPEAYHKDFAGIRRRIIEKAVAELQKKLGIKIEWKPKYRGRKVVGLVFDYAPTQAGDQSVFADEEDNE